MGGRNGSVMQAVVQIQEEIPNNCVKDGARANIIEW